MRISNKTFALMLVCLLTLTSACSKQIGGFSQGYVKTLADRVWAYSATHPDGFTVDVRTMDVPSSGIAVCYAPDKDFLGEHGRNCLEPIVLHALQNGGYIGGWLNEKDGLYYFGSTRLFPEDSLSKAKQFGIDNNQKSIYILSTGTEIWLKH